VLGICRGAQLINVVFGGTLYQDLKTDHPEAIDHHNEQSYEKTFHDITIEPETGLSRLYPELRTARVNSIHHQGVKTLGRELTVEAWSVPDKVAEAVRWNGRSYVLGVQWHPEFHRPADDRVLDPTPILDEFLTAVRKQA
jgi:putative glutamine amidotransferase